MQKDTLTMLARTGYAARGAIYLVIGALAVQAAFSGGGRTTGSRGAIEELASQPAGQLLVALVAAGLIGYSVWRFVQAVYDADDHGRDAKAVAIRGGLLASSVTHAILAMFAIGLLIGAGGASSSGGSGTQAWTAELLSQPFGQWLVGIVGVAIIGVGIAHAIKAWKTRFERYLDMSEKEMKIARPIAIAGLVARGVVFVVIGGFLLVAAWQAQPNEARSLGETLGVLQEQPYGAWLLGFVAFGLFAFGIYSGMEALYREIPQPGGQGSPGDTGGDHGEKAVVFEKHTAAR